MVKLDLNKLPEISNTIGLLRYDPFREYPELKNLGEISERIYGCAYFNGGGNGDNEYCDFAKKAQLRAALNEFVSISEMLKKNSPVFSIEKTDFPLFHFFKELRIANFHLRTFVPNTSKGKVSTANGTLIIDVDWFIIENCNPNLFAKNNNYTNHYNSSEFIKTIEWVNEHQKTWGIFYIIRIALVQYCELIQNNFEKIIL